MTRPGSALVHVAALVRRLAVLLGAGIAPAVAWRNADRGPLEEAAASVAASAARSPASTPSAIAALAGSPGRRAPREAAGVAAAWAGLAATWEVATAAGAPLAGSLRAFAEVLEGFASAERDVRVALSGPRATQRLVLVLPVIAIGFGALLGQDAFGTLIGTPLGWTCLVLGGGLMLAAWAWTRRMLGGAGPPAVIPGLVEELTAVAMSGGVSVSRAKGLVAAAIARHVTPPPDPGAADATLELAAATGAPAGELLRAEAAEARRAAVGAARERAERLSVLLMLPLGACVLPAFVAVGVVPLMASVIGSTVAAV